MMCFLKWNITNFENWQNRFNKVICPSLLQSYNYARAVCLQNQQTARWGLIEIDGQEAGIVQITEAGILKNALHAVVLDRGPLWFEGYGNNLHFAKFVEEFNRQFPKRIGRKRRFIPEMSDSEPVRNALTHNGFKQQTYAPYKTILLDLRATQEDLRMHMKKKWRNSLSKGEKSAVSIEWDQRGIHLPWLLKAYKIDKAVKGYDGPSVKLLDALSREFVKSGDFIIGRAMLDNEAIGAILILKHGKSATYQIGWTSDKGRHYCAHNVLLWQAMCMLKEQGLNFLDLGGINEDSASGVTKFKNGMGGKTLTLPGIYT